MADGNAGSRAWISIEEARERYPHGTHARYVLARCRCFPCRVANSNYEAERSGGTRPPWHVRYSPSANRFVVRNGRTGEIVFRGEDRDEAYLERDRLNRRDHVDDWPGKLVDVNPVVRHLCWLQSQGIGPKTVSRLSGVSYSVLQRMLGSPTGRRIYRTRVRTAERILAVTPRDVVGGQRIPAGPTWGLIECLLSAGWKRWQVAVAVTPSTASQVGHGQRPGLQIRRDVVRASTAAKVRQIHDEAWRADPRVRSVCNHLTHGDDANAEAKRRSRERKVAS
jgi:hypothetical protein